MRFGVRNVVRAHDGVELIFDVCDLQAPQRAVPELTRHQAEPLARLFQGAHLGGDAVVGADHGVMVREVVGAVGLDHGADLGGIGGPVAELYPQRRAEARHPDVVGRLDAAVGFEGVAIRLEDQLDGVDQRSVEVEQERGERHTVNLT